MYKAIDTLGLIWLLASVIIAGIGILLIMVGDYVYGIGGIVLGLSIFTMSFVLMGFAEVVKYFAVRNNK